MPNMQISDYLNEIQHAVETILSEVYREQTVVNQLQKEKENLIASTESGYRGSEFLTLNSDLDDDGLGTAKHWETYFGPDQKRHHKVKELEKAEEALEAHRFSIAAMAGSILQYAKQGIALRYGPKKVGCPDGRMIASMPLHEVIWQGRNQANHWEEGSLLPPVQRCFKKLSQINAIFEGFNTRSMAFDVLCELGWDSFEKFATDMRLLERT